MIIYEWIVNEVDEFEDIIEVSHFDTRKDAQAFADAGPNHGGVKMEIALVRDVGNDLDGLTDRSWAYLRDDGTLPEHFDYGMGEEGPRVPKRFHGGL